MYILQHHIARSALVLLALCLLSAAAQAQEPRRVETAIWDRVNTKAITGGRILFKGQEMLLENLTCPDVDKTAGRDAKALMNTFLRRAGHFECDVVELPDSRLRGRCTVAERRGLKGRNLSTGMVQSGLCHAGDRTKGQNT
ncbi:hypothetical protein [Neptunicoccus cionae]|uniref:Nuclease n=1 Tax=Neptunicoccus cionae TaxID=2035344 RepID=A0A916QS37_9RHOB|nr:hypothetical protein [Amylibacter cionae]GGA05373.1 hypothetical protein GCM10011498_01240 [Amylibacter cionae]